MKPDKENKLPQRKQTNILQRGFHDHIIRNRKDYEEITKYIYENPIRLHYDEWDINVRNPHT